jgi:hypothetical protein
MTFKAGFPGILAPDLPGHERPEAIEAGSGCNILILPIDASVLRRQVDVGNDQTLPVKLIWARGI